MNISTAVNNNNNNRNCTTPVKGQYNMGIKFIKNGKPYNANLAINQDL